MPSYTEIQQQAEGAGRRVNALDRRRVAVCVDTSSIAVGALGSFVVTTNAGGVANARRTTANQATVTATAGATR